MALFSDKKILESWKKNASPWLAAIRGKQIESRALVTDSAIVESITTISGNTVLDIGCGEGWLARELAQCGLLVTGIDAVLALINDAKELGGGTFHVLEYENISDKTIAEEYDIAVCNFSLLGKESVEYLFQVMPSLLKKGGYFVVQTLHPDTCCGELDYLDGWRVGSWAGFSEAFSDPAPWYFRTKETWIRLFQSNGFNIESVNEPINPNTGLAASLILVGRATS